MYKIIPILPEAFLTFARKSSVGPSYAGNGQEDHKIYTNLNDDTIIMMKYTVYHDHSKINFDSIVQHLNVLRNEIEKRNTFKP